MAVIPPVSPIKVNGRLTKRYRLTRQTIWHARHIDAGQKQRLLRRPHLRNEAAHLAGQLLSLA